MTKTSFQPPPPPEKLNYAYAFNTTCFDFYDGLSKVINCFQNVTKMVYTSKFSHIK